MHILCEGFLRPRNPSRKRPEQERTPYTTFAAKDMWPDTTWSSLLLVSFSRNILSTNSPTRQPFPMRPRLESITYAKKRILLVEMMTCVQLIAERNLLKSFIGSFCVLSHSCAVSQITKKSSKYTTSFKPRRRKLLASADVM